MIARPLYLKQVSDALRRSPIVALLGPRQCGKTTLARLFAAGRVTAYFDLESQPDARRLQNPEFALGRLEGIAILDEIQERPDLFKVLRVLADRPKSRVRFLILGSASPHIVKNVSETLAGRVEFVELAGFDLRETGAESLETLWV
ncbi:MAG: AAA family ATPase, partial [candidate division NC10 bacterium]